MINFCVTRYNHEIIAGTSSGLQGCNALPLITGIKIQPLPTWSNLQNTHLQHNQKACGSVKLPSLMVQKQGLMFYRLLLHVDKTGKEEGQESCSVAVGPWKQKGQFYCLNSGIYSYLRSLRVFKVGSRWMADTWKDLWEAVPWLVSAGVGLSVGISSYISRQFWLSNRNKAWWRICGVQAQTTKLGISIQVHISIGLKIPIFVHMRAIWLANVSTWYSCLICGLLLAFMIPQDIRKDLRVSYKSQVKAYKPVSDMPRCLKWH